MYLQPSQGLVLRGSDLAQMRLEPLEMMNECVAKCSTRLQYFERGRGGNVDVVLDRVLRDCRQSLELRKILNLTLFLYETIDGL